MTDWVAVSVDLGDDPKVIAFGKYLRVPTDTAAMSLVRLWGRMARHEMETGDLTTVDDVTLEEWARWRGKRGRFAVAFRNRFTKEGTVNGWWSWNGRHLRRARLDREKKRKERGYDEPPELRQKVHDMSADSPQTCPPTVPRLSDAITGTGTGITTNHTVTDRISVLMKRLPDTGGARWAVTEFLEKVPGGRSDGWVPILSTCLDGLDLPGGRPCTAEQLATTCRDFLTKPPHEWTPKWFRTCVRALMRDAPGNGERTTAAIIAQNEQDRKGVVP